ncbi:hypothetical protein CH253_16800 [Rhodococcus sp. 06-156-3C]|nr:hypothetical protein CH280_06125 [Rhodococcus sp. 06-156-4C]OZD18953.1 hypothetical protein CH253_16800 [Rhodococcus sp. 06-156-3C]OZD22466.1 hypothetical protein CH248_08385 [Rhodococcus sp. 06-156-4a]OZD34167.1 hypothetical protein CH247_08210 [Rhodococcus sp. 06-156-3b]OZD38904.1 hypothetical protein CH284_06630 [Rhodococcus sp. 06-156-3]OZF57364.1 hypothetical protein CH290_27415 [Rhodococcus sp. 06-156-4]
MIYAATYATYKLRNPASFVRSLIDRGEAGNTTNIGTDYPMLETAGIVRVVDGTRPGYFGLELLQSEVAEDALQILDGRDQSGVNPDAAAAVRAQRSYVHVEQERARLAVVAPTDDVDTAKLVAALRQEAARHGRGGR